MTLLSCDENLIVCSEGMCVAWLKRTPGQRQKLHVRGTKVLLVARPLHEGLRELSVARYGFHTDSSLIFYNSGVGDGRYEAIKRDELKDLFCSVSIVVPDSKKVQKSVNDWEVVTQFRLAHLDGCSLEHMEFVLSLKTVKEVPVAQFIFHKLQ